MTYAPTQEQRELMTMLNGGDARVNVKVRKLHDDAVIPQYATAGAAGFDLVAVEDVIIAPGETKKVPLGLAFEIPEVYVMYVCMRSGIALRTKLRQSNGIGVIDSDYRGEVAMMFDNISQYSGDAYHYETLSGETVSSGERYCNVGDGYMVRKEVRQDTYLIRKGDRIAQGVLAKVPRAAFVEVAELDETERGSGGFGSSGIRAEVSE